MKLLILSDLHATHEPFAIDAGLEYDIAVLAGDILEPGREVASWIRNSARVGEGKPVIQIAGNHEFYDLEMASELSIMRRNAKAHGVHFLDCDEVVVDQIRFLGCTLWTDFALRIDFEGFPGKPVRLLSDRSRAMTESARVIADYASIQVSRHSDDAPVATRRLTPMDTLSLHRAHRSWLRQRLAEPFDGKTVVITHHAPHRNSLAAKYADDWSSAGFVTEMRPEFFEAPAIWIHGHTHDSFDYTALPCRVQSPGLHELAWRTREQGLQPRAGHRGLRGPPADPMRPRCTQA